MFDFLSGALSGFGQGEVASSGGKESNTPASSGNPASQAAQTIKGLFSPTAAGGAAPTLGAAEAEGGATGANSILAPLSAGGSAAVFADADLKEPGGDAHWTLREEKDFILAKNQHTGETRKLLTAPLSDKESQEAQAPHGAGDLDSPDRQHTNVQDMNLGGSYADVDLAGAVGTPSSSPHDVVKHLVNQHVHQISQSIVDALDAKFKKAK